MATKEGKSWWDPYETSNRRQFIYQPVSTAGNLLCPMSTSFIDSCSQSRPFGSTVYSKDFCWKPACKPECTGTGTASGPRRNNPHPSQSFLMWRLPRDVAQSSEYVDSPWKCPPSEAEIRKALTAQYRSTYGCDFTSMPQGYGHSDSAERRLAPKHSRRGVLVSTDTEMRDNYRPPEQKNELLHYSYNTDLKAVCRGIVPTVVQRHFRTRRSDLTSYDRFCGKRDTCVMKSLQQPCRILPEDEKEAVKAVMSKHAHPNNKEKVNKLPAVVFNSCSPEWTSSWPGPL